MLSLTENEIRSDLRQLEDAWSGKASFAILPDKLSVSRDWLDQNLALIPSERQIGHFVLLTSGTTGQPKLVVGARDRAAALSRELHHRQDSEMVRQTISVLPIAYSYSFVNQWLWAREHGRCFSLTAGLGDPTGVVQSLADADQAMLCLVGIQVPLIASGAEGRSFPGVVRLHFAGGRFPQERLEELYRFFPNAQVYNNYGCAEAMPRLTVRAAGQSPDAANVGKPLKGVELKIGDDAAVLFRSPYGAVGVVENGAYKNIEAQDWIPSGDMGVLEADGSLRLLGRGSEVFKRHGEKVSIASLATTVGSVWSRQFTFYRDTDASGEEGCALVLAPAANVDEIRPILFALRKHHPRSHWPLRVEVMRELPILPNGKPDLRTIKASSSKSEIWRQHI
jgi:acyl-CoA synthetase (AMP-forming)/AMP-acid ligase II